VKALFFVAAVAVIDAACKRFSSALVSKL